MIDLFKLCKGNLPVGLPEVAQQISVFQHRSPDAKTSVDSDLKKTTNTKPKQKPNTKPTRICALVFFFSFAFAPLIFCFCFLFSSVRIGEYSLPCSFQQIESVVCSCSRCFFCKNSFRFFCVPLCKSTAIISA